jgi:hypothetical protein
MDRRKPGWFATSGGRLAGWQAARWDKRRTAADAVSFGVPAGSLGSVPRQALHRVAPSLG